MTTVRSDTVHSLPHFRSEAPQQHQLELLHAHHGGVHDYKKDELPHEGCLWRIDSSAHQPRCCLTASPS